MTFVTSNKTEESRAIEIGAFQMFATLLGFSGVFKSISSWLRQFYATEPRSRFNPIDMDEARFAASDVLDKLQKVPSWMRDFHGSYSGFSHNPGVVRTSKGVSLKTLGVDLKESVQEVVDAGAGGLGKVETGRIVARVLSSMSGWGSNSETIVIPQFEVTETVADDDGTMILYQVLSAFNRHEGWFCDSYDVEHSLSVKSIVIRNLVQLDLIVKNFKL